MEDGDVPISMQLGHNGLAVYAIKSTSKLGTYRAMFSEEDSNIIFNADKTRYYIRPSASDETVQLCNVRRDFLVSDLYNQFYDNKLQDFVYVLKDLTSIYSVGNRLEFEFEVVNEYEDETMTFENINYFKEAYAKLTDATVSLNISDYIIE